MKRSDFKKIGPFLWEIAPESGMRVPARIYMSEKMIDAVLEEKSIDQLMNVAALPGIEKYAFAMPDIHQGYGFPIGGVAAMRAEDE